MIAKAEPSSRFIVKTYIGNCLFMIFDIAGNKIAAADFYKIVFYNGFNGVEQNNVEAARWYRKAADQNNVDSQFALGFMYLKGEGVPKDTSEAFRLTRLAAYQGHLKAQANMAGLYGDGAGVLLAPAPDLVQAVA